MANIYLISALLSVTIAGFSQILLKKGAMRPHESFLKDYLNAPVIVGYIMMFISVLATMFAYRGLPMMTVPVIEALGFVLVPVLSFFFFREKFTKTKIIGIFIIILGIIIYNV